MNKLQCVLIASSLGLITGLYLGSTQKNLALTVGIATGGALFGGGVVAAFYQEKNKKLTTDFQQKISTLTTERDKLKKEFENLQSVHLETSKLKDKALSEVENLKTRLELLDNSLKDYQYRNEKDKAEISLIKETNLRLNYDIKKLEDTVENKEAELDEFNKKYQNNLNQDVEVEFEKRKAEVIRKEIDIDEEITDEAIGLIESYKAYVDKIMDRHRHNREILMKTNSTASEHIANIVNTNNSAYQALFDEKQELELQKQMLQQQLNGELVSPETRKDMVGTNWKIANLIVTCMWEEFEIPLKITGVDETSPDGVVTIALGFSKSANPTGIIERLNSNSQRWAKNRAIYYMGNARLSSRYPAILISVRRDKPPQDATGEVYKDGLIPANLFAEIIHKALDPDKGGKPTLRVMGGTGDGKCISLKNYLVHLIKQSGWEIWLSDPVHGLAKDYWDCPKLATDAKTAAKAYKNFVSLHDTREKDKIDGFTNLKVVGIFDEFDRNHSKEQHDEALRVMASIRHTQMRQILVGQCAEVGKNGWNWGDMTNCSLLAIEKSIGILKKHLKKDMGWSANQMKNLERDYNRFIKWRDQQNADNPDRPYENRIRLGMLIIGDTYKFLEIPMAYKGYINSDKAIIRESFDNVSDGNEILGNTDHIKENSHSTTNILSVEDREKPVYCPKCHSKTITEVEPYADGRRKFRCGKGHKFPVQKDQIRK